MMENYFTESGEATFFQLSASKFISENHFTESAENHFSLKKLFGRTPAGFSRESTLGALPNGAYHLCSSIGIKSSINKFNACN